MFINKILKISIKFIQIKVHLLLFRMEYNYSTPRIIFQFFYAESKNVSLSFKRKIRGGGEGIVEM